MLASAAHILKLEPYIVEHNSSSDIWDFLANDWALVEERFPSPLPRQEGMEGTHLAAPSNKPLVTPDHMRPPFTLTVSPVPQTTGYVTKAVFSLYPSLFFALFRLPPYAQSGQGLGGSNF